MRRNVKVIFSNGFERIISIKGSDEYITDYFLGKEIDVGIFGDKDEEKPCLSTATKVVFSGPDVVFNNPFATVNNNEFIKYKKIIIQSTPHGREKGPFERMWLDSVSVSNVLDNLTNEAACCCHDVFENISNSEILDYPNCFNKIWEIGKKLDAHLPKTGGV